MQQGSEAGSKGNRTESKISRRQEIPIVETSGDNGERKRSRLTEGDIAGLVFAGVGRITTIQPEGSETL